MNVSDACSLTSTLCLLDNLSYSHSTSADVCYHHLSAHKRLGRSPPLTLSAHDLTHTVRKQTRSRRIRQLIPPGGGKSSLISHNKVLVFSSYLRAACQLQCLQSIPLGNLPLIVRMRPSVMLLLHAVNI